MDFEVIASATGQISIRFYIENNSYKLFRNFIKGNLNHSDSVIKNLLVNLDKDLDKPLNVGDSEAKHIVKEPQHVANINIANLSSKMDLLFKAISGIKPIEQSPLPTIKFDIEILDGFAKRIEQTVQGIINNKTIAINDEQIIRQLSEIKQQLSICMASVQKNISIPSLVIPQVVVKEENQPLAPTAFVGQDMIRYPSNEKKVQPKCFGIFLSKESSSDTPCLSCVWINECSAEKKPKSIQNDTPKPPCFGNYKKDLDCSLCASNISSECINIPK